ncbi:MAG: DUF3108 domain-containing protein [Planctomycetota bacterium]|jgi:hypothetical protein|nr:DUF3108 domain-containing protein [Planctomycetota bacterium]MDP6939493.1 DUF3108 domain-containing protein [Planctomycetota bacterium]
MCTTSILKTMTITGWLVVGAVVGLSSTAARGSDGSLLVERVGGLAFTIPEAETLSFEVIVDIPLVGATGLGSFELVSGTEAHQVSVFEPTAGVGGQAPRAGWIRGSASGACLNYVLKHEIDLRVLPQEWPRVIYRDTQSGTENRRRELMYGLRNGQPTSLYRRDGHCVSEICERPEHRVEKTWLRKEHHCNKCKRGAHRDWRKPTVQEVPVDGVDMLSAVFLARSMVQNGLGEVKFPMLDKDRWWDVTLTLGESRRIVTKGGTFECRAVKMTPVLPSGKSEKFKGLFGIHGSLAIWLEKGTGVPVSIEGVLPAGPLDVGINLRLKGFRGTPEEFAPVNR